ncbi:MAG: helix-turn-helix domain-containing protein [Eubacteriales bacterium]|nr:helix-turn-helix domain-containing protein [Eubacteriales bacterium]
MDHSRYTISQAAEMLEVKDSVLRYWEDELDLRVHRNGQGHRYYTGYDIQLFMNIKELKRRGLQLRTIRGEIPQIAMKAPGSTESKIKLLPMKEEAPENPKTTDAENACMDRMCAFHEILERLIREELKSKEEGEKRFRSLDQTIRRHQIARREAAASMENKKNYRKSRKKR